MSSLPVQDERSKAVLLQMLEDEAKHATNAINAGGYRFPLPVKLAMSGVSKIMTKSVYKINYRRGSMLPLYTFPSLLYRISNKTKKIAGTPIADDSKKNSI